MEAICLMSRPRTQHLESLTPTYHCKKKKKKKRTKKYKRVIINTATMSNGNDHAMNDASGKTGLTFRWGRMR